MTAVEEIRSKIDLVELIGESVALKPSGQNFKANCPFHQERTPSFYVDPARQTWHCFGACSTGGDAFSFVMRRDSLGFADAIRVLAARAGVEIEASDKSRAKSGKLSELRAINKAAAAFFHDTLMLSPEGAPVREYLEKRGLTKDTIEDYRLGLSPANAAPLLKSLAKDGHNEDSLLEAGLLRKSLQGPGTYPFFHGRLMIPIQDARGEYIGFGAREMDGSKPKYLNSAQNPVFDKSSVLYGLHRAADAIKKERLGVLVEGYMDVLMAHQYGFRNVVAAMGTALADRQVTTLRRLASSFVLALDPDAAGDEATLRSLESSWRILDQPAKAAVSGQAMLTGPVINPDLVLKVMDLPRGVDPDDLIRNDPGHWIALIQTAVPVVDYVFASMAKRFDATTPSGKATLTQRLSPFIFQTPNVYEQNHRIAKLAVLLREEENVVKLALGAARKQSARGPSPRRDSQKDAPPLARAVRDPLEAYCLAMLLRYPELAPNAPLFHAAHLSYSAFQQILEGLSRGQRGEDIRTDFPEELSEELDWLIEYPLPPSTLRERELGLMEGAWRLEQRWLRLQSQVLQEKVADRVAENPGSILDHASDGEALRELLLRNFRKSG